ncbi:GNAT family N-acetyltransferase [Nakamurella endophytica]|uniref:GNAT family N-acetyltransferase n=1 Tax=Nakamurella endophytica TaxID=1748367 RepID=UPI001E4EBC44|nr:GNAT family N-acetyltransferase [Nakamurella endophytica]
MVPGVVPGAGRSGGGRWRLPGSAGDAGRRRDGLPVNPSGHPPLTAAEVTVVPADQASWADILAVLCRSDAGRCLCQRFKVPGWIWRDTTLAERTAALREQTGCDRGGPGPTSGLVGYVDGEPAGWVAVEPRTAYPKLRSSRIPWAGRDTDPDDDGVWAVTCLVVRTGHRGRGLTYVLARAAADHARAHGARAVEAYGMVTRPGRPVTWGELHVGARQVFEEAGFREVTHPTPRRVVLRMDFGAGRGGSPVVGC